VGDVVGGVVVADVLQRGRDGFDQIVGFDRCRHGPERVVEGLTFIIPDPVGYLLPRFGGTYNACTTASATLRNCTNSAQNDKIDSPRILWRLNPTLFQSRLASKRPAHAPVQVAPSVFWHEAAVV
jgi:hypothetical protein